MNESEARRVALTAAVTVNTTWNLEETSAILALAERFETWLLRPSVNVGTLSTDAVHRVVNAVPEQGTWCSACGIMVAWCVHTTAVDSVPVNVPEQREVPSTRPNPWCSYCEHGPHAGPTCVHCACTGRAPEAPQCRNCHHDVSTHTSHGCTHGRGHLDSGWSGVCGCPYTAVDFRDGNAPSVVAVQDEIVVTLPEQRGVRCTVCWHPEHDQSSCTKRGCECLESRAVKSTVPHDPYMDGPEPRGDVIQPGLPHVPCIGFREGLPDTSYGCSHSRFAHGSRGCTVDGCACERRTA